MDLTNYEVLYIIMNMFRTYVVFRYMCIFYERKETNKRLELLTYLGYYIGITALYLVLNVPIVMMVSNLLGFIILSFNYKTTIKQRILSSVIIYVILLCIESVVTLLTGYINFPIFYKNYYSSIMGIVSIQIVSYIVALVLQNFKKIRSGKFVTNSYWLGILTIPIASLFIILTLFFAEGLSIVQILSCIIFLFGINIVTFSLYDCIIDAFEGKMVEKMLFQQNNFYEKQFEIMKISIANTQSVRHDLVNHLYTIQSLNLKNETHKVNEYLADLLNAFNKHKEYLNSGNLIIDSIVNFKLQEAEQKKIKIELEVAVPQGLEITSFDMTVILGNLLDNALNAVSKLVVERRKINLQIRYNKGILIIKISNYFDGVVFYEEDRLTTSNIDKVNHGIGLSNVKDTIAKYQGILDIECNAYTFNVTAILYVKIKQKLI